MRCSRPPWTQWHKPILIVYSGTNVCCKSHLIGRWLITFYLSFEWIHTTNDGIVSQKCHQHEFWYWCVNIWEMSWTKNSIYRSPNTLWHRIHNGSSSIFSRAREKKHTEPKTTKNRQNKQHTMTHWMFVWVMIAGELSFHTPILNYRYEGFLRKIMGFGMQSNVEYGIKTTYFPL